MQRTLPTIAVLALLLSASPLALAADGKGAEAAPTEKEATDAAGVIWRLTKDLDDPKLKELNDKEYQARVELENALRKIDPQFAETHASYVKARDAKSKSSEPEIHKAYGKELANMCKELRLRGQKQPSLAKQLKAYNDATTAKENHAAKLLQKAKPDQLEAFMKAVKTLRKAQER